MMDYTKTKDQMAREIVQTNWDFRSEAALKRVEKNLSPFVGCEANIEILKIILAKIRSRLDLEEPAARATFNTMVEYLLQMEEEDLRCLHWLSCGPTGRQSYECNRKAVATYDQFMTQIGKEADSEVQTLITHHQEHAVQDLASAITDILGGSEEGDEQKGDRPNLNPSQN